MTSRTQRDIELIQTRVMRLESERIDLLRESSLLKSENKWYRDKVSQLETCLSQTDEKHQQLKKTQEEQRLKIQLMESTIQDNRHRTDQSEQIREVNESYLRIRREKEEYRDRCQLLESQNRELRSNVEELQRKNGDLFESYSAEKMEREFLASRANKLVLEKTQVERERAEYKQHLERVLNDVTLLRNKEIGYDTRLGDMHKAINDHREANRYLDDKLKKYRHKVKKYKRLYKEAVDREQTLEHELTLQRSSLPDTHSKPIQTEEISSVMHSKIIQLAEQLNFTKDQISELRTQLRSTNTQLDQERQENGSLRSLISQLNMQINESDQTKKVMTRELETKQSEIRKRNKLIGNFIFPTFKSLNQSLEDRNFTMADLGLGSGDTN